MDEGLPWGESPIDHEGDTEAGLGWATSVIFTGSLFLIFLNAHAIANWANHLEISQKTAPIITAAGAWHEKMGDLGLNVVVDRVKELATSLRKASW